MSYNIDNWKIKRLENFTIPMSAFFESQRKDWHPEIEKNGEETILYCGCEQEIIGVEKDGIFHINHINMSGEGSGSFFHHVFDNALKKAAVFLKL